MAEKTNKVANVGNETSVRKLVGPARKNPFAAGRAGNTSAVVRAVPPLQAKPLTGPAYKNRKQQVLTVSYGEPRRATRRQIKTGPRYKNRSAKTGG